MAAILHTDAAVRYWDADLGPDAPHLFPVEDATEAQPVPDTEDPADAEATTDRLLAAIRSPIEIDDDLVRVVQTEVDRMRRLGIDKILLSSHLQDIQNEIELVSSLDDVDAVIEAGRGLGRA